MRDLYIKTNAFDAIDIGIKSIEIRLNYGFNTTLKNEEVMNLCCNNKSLIIKVKNIRYYDNLDELLDVETLGISKSDAIELYTSLYGKKLNRYKLLCFDIHKN